VNSENTRPVEDQEEFVPTDWELVLRSPAGERRFPVHRAVIRLSGEQTGGPEIKLHVKQGGLFFSTQPALLLQGEPTSFGQLVPGQALEWNGYRLLLVDTRARGSLQCFSDPYDNRTWILAEDRLLLGRAGKRDNHVILDHPTISRAHATLEWRSRRAFLRGETDKGRTRVDGRDLTAGEEAELHDGDLLELGELVFRFRLVGAAEEPAATGLVVHSLGGLSVKMGDKPVTEKSWRTQNARWLMARLALEWGRPLAVELLLDLFWPDSPPDRARNSLNFLLSSLRALLGPNILVRNAQALQLNPECLLRHDYLDLRTSLDEGARLRAAHQSEEALKQFQQAHRLYSGAYLEGCYQDWALAVRTHLEHQVLEVGRSLSHELRAQGRLDEAAECAQRNLLWDSCCQHSTATLMACHIERGHAQEALRVYETSQKNLQRELGVEPSIDVLREYYRAQACL
jgi:DNA-binding SARP family transcriptional activator